MTRALQRIVQINLSYVLTTRNKLPYLREVMARLIHNVQPDEELVVVDGASTDGTVDYLESLYEEGKIHQLLCESDRGEAHGCNKGLLKARGELIKLITDDDVFSYTGIQTCKKFMLEHRTIDLLGTEGANVPYPTPRDFSPDPCCFTDLYLKWQRERCSFSFSGLGLMLRRSSLPLLGLFHTGFVWVDHEFTQRVSSGPGLLAWYSGQCWVRITNRLSNTTSQYPRLLEDKRRLEGFYNKQTAFGVWQRYLNATGDAFRSIVRPIKPYLFPSPHCEDLVDSDVSIQDLFQRCDAWLQEQHSRSPGECLLPPSEGCRRIKRSVTSIRS